MEKIKEVIVDARTLSLKKGRFGYRVVNPIRNKDGKIILINLLVGGWGNFFKLLFTLLIITLFLIAYQEISKDCVALYEDPCSFIDDDCSVERSYDFENPPRIDPDYYGVYGQYGG